MDTDTSGLLIKNGLVSANATVLALKRAPAAGAASVVLGAFMSGGGILVALHMALGGDRPRCG